MGFDMTSDFMNQNMLMGMDFSGNGLDTGNNGGITPGDGYMPNQFATGLHSSPIQHDLSDQIAGHMHDPGGGHRSNSFNSRDVMDKMAGVQSSDQMQNIQPSLSQPPMAMSSATPMGPIPAGLQDLKALSSSQPPQSLEVAADANSMALQAQHAAQQQVVPQYRNAYSASGFDMLRILMKVATRPDPQINIGAVDMSCAFVVCDVQQHDLPIVYCSDVFERLTAYTKHEILGRNCRFLQAPDGKIKSGVKRKYVDDQSVLRIKNMIAAQQETQISLINYRKGGQPFMNLLTMIPITYDTDEIKYYVGFQVDLVEQPSSSDQQEPWYVFIPRSCFLLYLTIRRRILHNQLPARHVTAIRNTRQSKSLGQGSRTNCSSR